MPSSNGSNINNAAHKLHSIMKDCAAYVMEEPFDTLQDELGYILGPFGDDKEFVDLVIDQMNLTSLAVISGVRPHTAFTSFILMGRMLERRAQEVEAKGQN